MKQISLKNSIKAILFASGEPFDINKLEQVLCITEEKIDNVIKEIDEENSPFKILKLDDSYQMSTKKEYANIVQEALKVKNNSSLSQAALEVLSIIAYNQPITKSFIEQVRGVDSSSIVNSLVKKELIEEAGRLKLPGRPISYKTTKNFLRCFGLKTIKQLPSLPKADGQQTIKI